MHAVCTPLHDHARAQVHVLRKLRAGELKLPGRGAYVTAHALRSMCHCLKVALDGAHYVAMGRGFGTSRIKQLRAVAPDLAQLARRLHLYGN